MVRVAPKFFGHEFQQAKLHLDDVFARCDAGAIGDAEDMGIHCDRRLAEGGIQDDVRGLPADTGQSFEVVAIRWHFRAELCHQKGASRDDVPCLRAIQADALDVRRQSGFAEREDFLRRIGQRKQLRGGEVDALVGGLGGEHDRNQQLERRLVCEFGSRRRIGGAQPGEDFCSFSRIHL